MKTNMRWVTLACVVGLAQAITGCAAEPELPGEESGQDVIGSGGAAKEPASSDEKDAPGPAATAAPAASPPPAAPPAAPAPGGSTTCTKTLTFAKASGKCGLGYVGEIHTSVAQPGTVTVTYPCAGGAVSLTLGSQTFTGTVNGTSIQLTHNGEFQTKEARGRGVYATCTVKNLEVITGDLATGTLSYSYSEKLASGVCYFAGTCTASGAVTVGP